jgi:hypothetical protein
MGVARPVKAQLIGEYVMKSVPSSYDPATSTWVNAVVTAGGTVSTAQKSNVNTLILALKSAGLFSILDRLWLFDAENTYQAGIDIINLGTFTPNGSAATFAAASGYIGTGGYFDSNVNPSMAGGHFALNSASLLLSVVNSRTTGENWFSGLTDATGTNYVVFEPLNANPTTKSQINETSNLFEGSTTNAQGRWIGTRTGSAATAIYLNGTSVATGSDASTAIPTGADIAIFSVYFAGFGPINASNDTYGYFGFGAGLNSTEAANFDTAIAAYVAGVP